MKLEIRWSYTNFLVSMSGIYCTLHHMGYVKNLGQYVWDILDFRSDGAMSNILSSISGILD